MENDLHLPARIVEHTPLVIAVTDSRCSIRYLNAKGAEILGVKRSEAYGTDFAEHIEHDEHGLAWSEVRELVDRGEPCETNVRVSGAPRGGVFKMKAFRIDQGDRGDALVFMLLDISDEAGKAEQIEHKNLEMARINSELIRSNAGLKKLSELKSSFLSIASHELKTPLTSIKGYSDIIMDGMRDRLDDTVLRMIENINRAADRLHRVVTNILDVTRIEQNRLRLQLEDMSIVNVAEEVIEEVSRMTRERHIGIRRDFEENLPRLYADRLRIQQVFTNLLSNAIKFSPDDSEIELRIGMEDEQRFHIVLRDRGVGIDKSDQRRIFDPFYEVGSTTRHSTHDSRFMGGGSGLGLSIVKGIIECHGGRVWVESPGVADGSFPGSEFHVVLPVKAATTPDEEAAPDEEERAVAGEEAVEGKPHVLIIDSDPEAAEVAELVLSNAFETVVAHDGEKGLQLAFHRTPSLVLLDHVLPGMDGFRICRVLKTQDETRDVPVVFCTAHASEDEIRRCYDSGGDDLIVKPFGGRELVEKIWQVLMRKKEEATFR